MKLPYNQKDLTGQKFGRLTVLRLVPNPSVGPRATIWECKCDCGNIRYLEGYDLRSGNTTSCGCYQKEQRFTRPFQDLSGQKFGRLTLLYPLPKQPYSTRRYYHCKCDCGKEVDVAISDIKSGRTTSCGCYLKEVSHRLKEDLTGKRFGSLVVQGRTDSIRYGKEGRQFVAWTCRCDCGNIVVRTTQDLTRGHSTTCGDCHRTKGHTHEDLYHRWVSMRNRCYCESTNAYPNYGGRGIHICDEWRDNYMTFRKWAEENGFRPELTIDRIDVNGPYSPENCRWVSMDVQHNNKRTNRYVTVDAETRTLTQWAKLMGTTYDSIRNTNPDVLERRIRRFKNREQLSKVADKVLEQMTKRY